MAEYYNKETDTWEEKEPESMLQESYNYLSEKIPDVGQSIANEASNTIDYLSDSLSDFFTPPGRKGIPGGTFEVPQTDVDLHTSKNIAEYQNSPAFMLEQSLQKKYRDQAKNTSAAASIPIAAGHEIDKLALGLKNQVNKIPGIYQLGGEERIDETNKNLADKSNIMSHLSDVHPLSTTAGAVAPYLLAAPGNTIKTGSALMPAALKTAGKSSLSNVARGMFNVANKIPEGKLNRFVKGSAVGTATLPKNISNSLLADNVALGATVGSIHPDLTAEEGAYFAGAGHAIGKGGSKFFTTAKTKNNPEIQRIIDWGKTKGYDLDPGIKTGNKFLQQMDQAFRRNAQTGGAFHKADEINTALNNKMVSRAIGMQAKVLDGAWFDDAYKMLNDSYNGVRARITPKMLPNETSKLKNIQAKYQQIHQTNSPIVDAFGMRLHGNLRKDWSMDKKVWSDLHKDMKRWLGDNQNHKAKSYVEEQLDVLESMMYTGANKADLKKLKQLDQKWAMYNILRRKGVDDLGNANMKHLEIELHRRYPQQFLGAKGTGNKNIDDVYNAVKLNLIQRSPEGASLGMSDRVGRAFQNPGLAGAGAVNLTLNPFIGSLPAIDRMLIGMYRKGLTPNPAIIPNKIGKIDTQDAAGFLGSRLAISEQ